jgi:sulfur-carrier protein adenylyltransferase/sulfurtransferase
MKTMDQIFTAEELTRYQRQFPLAEVGFSGQQKIKAAKVLCVGAGGLGSPALLYLAGAGVGTLGIIDNDQVEASNLHRQVIYTTQQINKSKSQAAKDRIKALNPNVNITIYNELLNEKNALDIIRSYDFVLDGTDNFVAKYLINDACVMLRKPNIYASIYQFHGQCSVFVAGGPCYRCLHPHFPKGYVPNCSQAGVLGVLPGLLGTIQATEVLKLILGIGTPLIGKMLTVDTLTMQFNLLNLKQNTSCHMCQGDIKDKVLKQESYPCDISTKSSSSLSITSRELHSLMKTDKRLQLIDVRSEQEHNDYNIGGKVIPLNTLVDRLGELDKSQQIIVYCQTDKRSRDAIKILQQHDFATVYYLQGGVISYLSNVKE